MSVEYTFNKKISLDDIENKTNLKIVLNKDTKWLVDEFNNHVLINENNYSDENGNVVDSPTLELTVYGLNNPTKIMDELIKNFNAKFITDNEELLLFHNSELFDEIDVLYDNVMEKYGYLNNGIISIPNRIESDYKSFGEK